MSPKVNIQFLSKLVDKNSKDRIQPKGRPKIRLGCMLLIFKETP